MAIVEFTVAPFGTGTPSLSKYVAGVQKVVEEQAGEIKYMLTPMGTILEGDLDEILALIRRAHEVPFTAGALRVSTQIKIDDRRDKQATMEGKIKSVREKM
ncbi:MAG TPA: MTH1187 family thiamine-binding protein [Firmicutes bacterium]|jgi:uncharacterized protein (TIGR00106 family)|nr:MTH1187 family thiamine-binding protein [Bacillota bacterium]